MIGDKLYVFTGSYLTVPSVERWKVGSEPSLFYETGRQYLDRLGEDLYDQSRILVRNFDEAGNVVGNPEHVIELDQALGIVREGGIATSVLSFDVTRLTVGPSMSMPSPLVIHRPLCDNRLAYLFDSRGNSTTRHWTVTRRLVSINSSSALLMVPSNRESQDPSLEVCSIVFSIGVHQGNLQIFTTLGESGSRLTILRPDVGGFQRSVRSPPLPQASKSIQRDWMEAVLSP